MVIQDLPGRKACPERLERMDSQGLKVHLELQVLPVRGEYQDQRAAWGRQELPGQQVQQERMGLWELVVHKGLPVRRVLVVLRVPREPRVHWVQQEVQDQPVIQAPRVRRVSRELRVTPARQDRQERQGPRAALV